MAMIAVILLNTTVMPLVAVFGGGSRAWTIVAAIMGIISIVLLLITFATTKERVGIDNKTENGEGKNKQKKEQLPIGIALKALFTNKYWINRMIFALAITIATMTTSANVYYAQYWLGDENITGILSIANVIPMLIALAFVNFFLKRIGNRNTSLLGAGIMLIGFVIQFIAPASYMMVLIGTGIRGFGTGLASTVTAVMLGDTIDYGEWKSGIRMDGLIYSASSFGTKVGTGVATASLGWALGIGNFDAALAVQGDSALASIKFPRDEIRQVYEGFEVASHAYRHETLPGLKEERFDEVIGRDIDELSELVGYQVVGHAFPGGMSSKSVRAYLKQRGILYGRGAFSDGKFTFPQELINYSPTCSIKDKNIIMLFNKFLASDTEKEDLLFYVWGHGYEMDYGTTRASEEAFEKIFDYMSGHEDIIYCTNKEAFMHINNGQL